SFISRTHMPSNDFNQKFERTTLTQDVVGFTFAPHVNAMAISGPFNATRPEHTTTRDKVFSCYPENADQEPGCAKTILSTLATQAYRRPLQEDDVNLLLSFYEAGRTGGDFETGIQRGLQFILSDPEFIYRMEGEPADNTDKYFQISELELASRLSFFLWSSAPDAELLQVATEGKLRNDGVLQQQVERMLADPRADALVSNFAGQWLQLRNLQSASPVADLFPDFDDNL
ncbi:MAG: DUF1592 domain-containing protein, partial [Pseudomonadota bacterium]